MNLTDQKALIIEAQSNTAALLAESSAQGYIIDPVILTDYINQFKADVAKEQEDAELLIRLAMGWPALNFVETSNV